MTKSAFQWNRLWGFLLAIILTLYNHVVYKIMICHFVGVAETVLEWVEALLILVTIIMGIRFVIPFTKKMGKGMKIVLIALSLVLLLMFGNALLLDDSYVELWLSTPIADVHLDGENSYFVTYTEKADEDGIIFGGVDAEDIDDIDSYTTVKVRCDKEIAKHLIVDKDVQYYFEGRSFARDRENAVLRYIDLVDYCDNRGK
ncbi:MAG: hypothetical protein KBS74_07810 [Clostridiales bacterium]|nr:hypothetical protein [Candidatus Cacconaster stercorequi]